VKLVSNTSNANPNDDFSGIAYAPSGTLKVSDISNLSATLEGTPECGAGSPRFQIGVDTDGNGTRDGNAFVYLGTAASGYTICSAGSTGNLTQSSDARVDYSQLESGAQVRTWSQFVAAFGTKSVTGIQLVVDSGWNAGAAGSDQTQTIVVSKVTINGDTYQVQGPPTDKEQCKKDGWKSFNNPAFKNQGDCVSFCETGGRNPANPR
jgi:hypothetical protein